MWLALVIAVVGATGNNLGKALQKRAVSQLPRLRLERAVLKQYLRSRTYLIGLSADIFGALLNVVALASAPVSVVQPLMSGGLAILAVFSHFYLDERLGAREWLAVGVTGLGIVGLGISTEEEPQTPHIIPFRITACVMACVGILTVTTVHLHRKGRHPRAREPGHSLSLEELASGAHAGLCFGLSASSCRTGFMLAKLAGGASAKMVAGFGLMLSVVLTSTGLLVQTEALKDGRSVVVCTCTEAALMITAMVYGVYALGERMPATRAMQLLRYSSWIVIVVGISALSSASKGSHQGTARAGGARSPPNARKTVPGLLPYRYTSSGIGQEGCRLAGFPGQR